jgi:hypothetical protein
MGLCPLPLSLAGSLTHALTLQIQVPQTESAGLLDIAFAFVARMADRLGVVGASSAGEGPAEPPLAGTFLQSITHCLNRVKESSVLV